MNEQNHYEPDGSETQYAIEIQYGVEQGQDWLPWYWKADFLVAQTELYHQRLGAKAYAAFEIMDAHPNWWAEVKTIGEVYGLISIRGYEYNKDSKTWVLHDGQNPEPPSNPFMRGDRVSHESGERGAILKVYEDWQVRVGYDNGFHETTTMNTLEPAQPSPAFHQLPIRQQEFLLALRDKQPVVKNGATRKALRELAYIDCKDDWKSVGLTPYGRVTIDLYLEAVEAGELFDVVEEETDIYLEPDIDDSIAATEPSYTGDRFTEEYAEDRDELGDHYPLEIKTETVAVLPVERSLVDDLDDPTASEVEKLYRLEALMKAVDPDAYEVYQEMLSQEDVLAGLPTREETIKLHEGKKLILPPKRPGDNLFFEHDMAKELEDLRAQVNAQKDELSDSRKREQTLQAQLVEEQKTVIRQRQELEALKDVKLNAAMNGKSTARAYVTKTLVQVIDADPYGALFSERDLADDEINAHVDAGWRVVHEDTNSAFDPRADKIVHTRIIRFEQRPTSSRPPRPTAKAKATPNKAGQIIFEAGEIVETAFTFEEALKSGKFSANELAQIGDAEMLTSMRKTYQQQASSRPFTPLPLSSRCSSSVSQIIMEIKHDE